MVLPAVAGTLIVVGLLGSTFTVTTLGLGSGVTGAGDGFSPGLVGLGRTVTCRELLGVKAPLKLFGLQELHPSPDLGGDMVVGLMSAGVLWEIVVGWSVGLWVRISCWY